MRAAILIAALLFVAAPNRADAKASAASVAKLQKLASRVRGLKKGLTVVPKKKVSTKVASKAGKASAVRSNNVSRVTALRSLYRQMAALDFRACRTANLPKSSLLKASAGLRRLAVAGERAGLEDADLDDPDADSDLAQQCNACPSGTVAAGDDTYGLCYCADPADLAAAEAAASSDTVVDASTSAAVATSSVAIDTNFVPDVDTTIARLSRFEKVANRNLSEKATPKALPHAKIPAVSEWHYQRAMVYARMAAAATKPAFAAVKVGKDGKPQLAHVPTSAQLRKLVARLRAGAGPVTVARPLAQGRGYAVVAMPRSVAVRNTYAMMAALDLRAARLTGLPPAKAKAARTLYGQVANLTAGGRVYRKAGRKAGKKSQRKSGVRVGDDEDDGGGGGDSGGGEVDMGVEPVVYVDNSGGDSGGYADTGSADASYADTSSADSGSSDTSYADTSSEDSGSSDTSYADTSSDDSGSSDTSYADAGSGDSGSTDSSSSDAFAYGGADDNSGFGDTGPSDSGESAVADSGSADSAATDGGDASAWGAGDLADSNENAVADPFAGTSLTDQGDQDPNASSSAWGDLSGSEENAVADNGDASQPAVPDDWSESVGPDALQDAPNDPAVASPDQSPDAADALAVAEQDDGSQPSSDALDPSAGPSCSASGGAGVYRKAGNRKANGFVDACGDIAQQLGLTPDPGVPTLQGPQYPPVDVTQTGGVQPDPIPNPAPGTSADPNDALGANPMTAMGTMAQAGAQSAADWAQAAKQAATDAWTTNFLPGDASPHDICVGLGGCGAPDTSALTTPTKTPNKTPPCENDGSGYGKDYQDCMTPHAPGKIEGRVMRTAVACGPKSRVLRATKAGLTVCSMASRKAKVAGARKAGKPLYSHLARMDRAAMKASRGLADRQTPRSRKALLLYQRGQVYAHMAMAISTRRASRRTASKPHAKQADKVASKASPKSSAKPAKPVADDVAPAPAADQPAPPAPQPAPQPAPVAQPPAPAAPSAEDVLKQDMNEMDDMGKDMEKQIQQRGGH